VGIGSLGTGTMTIFGIGNGYAQSLRSVVSGTSMKDIDSSTSNRNSKSHVSGRPDF
jgi:hypothetical protein